MASANEGWAGRVAAWRQGRGLAAVIDKFEYLIALAREQHFGRAAEACGVTQQTLSAGLKNLEDRLGVLLVQRGSRYQGFTAEGERVLDYARRMVGDARALRQEIATLKRGLHGHLRLAAIPTALPMVASLTTPYRRSHPGVRFTILSRTSVEILSALEGLEADAGLTYLENEPLGRVTTIPLYRESYRLLTAAAGTFGERERVSWAEVGTVPLCLLTPDMQNRRIIDQHLRAAGNEPAPTLESNSMILLMTHVRTGEWASIIPSVLADTMGVTDSVRSIPIVEPDVAHTIGLVVPHREPALPLVSALVAQARLMAKQLQPAKEEGTEAQAFRQASSVD